MKLYETLEKQLKKEPNFVSDNGELKKWVVLNKAQNFNEELIGLLLDNPDLKKKFFVTVKGALVFNHNLFVQFMEQKSYLNDSYTQYKNKVGLIIDGKFVKQRNEVSLVWPYKDCILEGGQSREEDKREEIFFNEILAQDEITQLLEPKVLTDAKRIDKDGEKSLDQFNRNTNGIISDNLIIKGNNLLALECLYKCFSEQVDMIYIDPPFNTEHDSFQYNDKFSRSTWLTFMSNRLKVAKRLLKPSGTIYVHVDHNEGHYLKVLMDEIFGEEFFRNEIIWHYSGWNKKLSNSFEKRHDTIYMYGKSDKQYFASYFETWASKEEYVKRRKQKLLTDKDGKEYVHSDAGNGQRVKMYIEDVLKGGVVVDDVWHIDKLNNSSKESVDFKTQKVEVLIERFIEASCPLGGIILDFQLGSGTTASVAAKCGRQYIGIEQMEYINTKAVPRLINVIKGEQEGVSKKLSWKGGGEFVYFELKKYNQSFIEQIEKAKDTKSIMQIWEQMKVKSFLNYNVDIKKQGEHIEDFKALSLKEQKQHLCELLDKNQLYVNLSSLNDTDFACTKEEKKVTHDFYQIKK